jgi:hypothetical protein
MRAVRGGSAGASPSPGMVAVFVSHGGVAPLDYGDFLVGEAVELVDELVCSEAMSSAFFALVPWRVAAR